MTGSSKETPFYAWNTVSNAQLFSWLGIDKKDFFDQLHHPLELGKDGAKFIRPTF